MKKLIFFFLLSSLTYARELDTPTLKVSDLKLTRDGMTVNIQTNIVYLSASGLTCLETSIDDAVWAINRVKSYPRNVLNKKIEIDININTDGNHSAELSIGDNEVTATVDISFIEAKNTKDGNKYSSCYIPHRAKLIYEFYETM